MLLLLLTLLTTPVDSAVVGDIGVARGEAMNGSIDAFHRMSKSKERDSLAGRLSQCAVPVQVFTGTVLCPADATVAQLAAVSRLDQASH